MYIVSPSGYSVFSIDSTIYQRSFYLLVRPACTGLTFRLADISISKYCFFLKYARKRTKKAPPNIEGGDLDGPFRLVAH